MFSLCYGIFHSHFAYLCLVWRQAKFSLNRTTLLQKRTIRILHSVAFGYHTCPLFHRYKVLKFADFVSLENCIFFDKCFNDDAFSFFSNHFKLIAGSHFCCSRSVSHGLVFKRLYNSVRYGNKCIIIYSTVSIWNYFQTIFHVFVYMYEYKDSL